MLSVLRHLVIVLILVLSISIHPNAIAQPAAVADAPPPFACLFDTGTTSASPLLPETLAAKKGWTTVPEDNVTRAFAGDTVVQNDRVAIVLRRNAAGVELYSRSSGGFKYRAAILPLGAAGEGILSLLKIIENSQAAVMLEAAFKTKSGAITTFRFRVTAGESLVDLRGAQGASRLRICDQSQYVVIPDFFADDMVLDPAVENGSRRIGLPAENSLLGLTDNGGTIVACVWPSSRQNADLLLVGDVGKRTISGYEIDLPADGRLWIAVMEGRSIWHARRLPKQVDNMELALDWTPPFPARWRADFAAHDGIGRSFYFADAEKAASAKADASCFISMNRAIVRIGDANDMASSRLVVIYPIERTRTTPLDVFCLVDIMRNALGVGPCQYVLDAEKLGTGETLTPEPVTHWIEKQFEKKVSKRDVDAIREQLAQMSLQVKRTDARIGQYIDVARNLSRICADYAKTPESSTAANRFMAIADGMASPATAAFPAIEKLAADIAAQADREDASAKCQASLAGIRAAGSAQDYALGRLRMSARRLKQAARIVATTEPKAAEFAARIQQQAEQMLVKK
ncbi:MAG: hypothetical protein ABSH20_03800 [Tepidisphaeraceae bacterium]